jgi:GNAT superfamily N-acetyltransferase
MIDPDSYAIQEEPFASSWADSAELRAEHEQGVGPRAGVKLEPNVAFFQRLDEIGALQVMTIRSNGRMFGYLASIIAPSLENPAHIQASTSAFYVSKHMRGIGPRLLRAAIAGFRARGVNEVILRAGVRGSGPKAGALYRRLGAVPLGEMYSLMLGAG